MQPDKIAYADFFRENDSLGRDTLTGLTAIEECIIDVFVNDPDHPRDKAHAVLMGGLSTSLITASPHVIAAVGEIFFSDKNISDIVERLINNSDESVIFDKRFVRSEMKKLYNSTKSNEEYETARKLLESMAKMLGMYEQAEIKESEKAVDTARKANVIGRKMREKNMKSIDNSIEFRTGTI